MLTHLVRRAGVALCRMQGAISALWLQSTTSALRFRFGTLRQWCVKFLSMIFYPFWALHDRKLQIGFRFGLFDQGATKWVKFPNFSPGESISDRNLTPVVPKVSLQDFLLILAALPTKISIRSFSQNCDQVGQVSKF